MVEVEEVQVVRQKVSFEGFEEWELHRGSLVFAFLQEDLDMLHLVEELHSAVEDQLVEDL